MNLVMTHYGTIIIFRNVSKMVMNKQFVLENGEVDIGRGHKREDNIILIILDIMLAWWTHHLSSSILPSLHLPAVVGCAMSDAKKRQLTQEVEDGLWAQALPVVLTGFG